MSANASVNQTLMGTPTTRAVAGITAADSSGSSPAATGDVLIGHAGMLNELVRLDLTPPLASRGIAIKSQGATR